MRGTVAKQLNHYATSQKMKASERRALKRKHSRGERRGNAPPLGKHDRNVVKLGRTEVNRRREKRRVGPRRMKQ